MLLTRHPIFLTLTLYLLITLCVSDLLLPYSDDFSILRHIHNKLINTTNLSAILKNSSTFHGCFLSKYLSRTMSRVWRTLLFRVFLSDFLFNVRLQVSVVRRPVSSSSGSWWRSPSPFRGRSRWSFPSPMFSFVRASTFRLFVSWRRTWRSWMTRPFLRFADLLHLT